jgi:hypothetical protein
MAESQHARNCDTPNSSRHRIPTWLHQALRIRPGRAPKFVCSKNNCTGFDLLLAIDLVLIGAAMVSWRISLPVSVTIITFGIGFCFCIEQPFRARERFARAKIRRGED